MIRKLLSTATIVALVSGCLYEVRKTPVWNHTFCTYKKWTGEAWDASNECVPQKSVTGWEENFCFPSANDCLEEIDRAKLEW